MSGSLKPTHCPECGSENVLEIVYGLLYEPPGPGKTAGGCCIQNENWCCEDCRRRWYDPGTLDAPKERTKTEKMRE